MYFYNFQKKGGKKFVTSDFFFFRIVFFFSDGRMKGGKTREGGKRRNVHVCNGLLFQRSEAKLQHGCPKTNKWDLLRQREKKGEGKPVKKSGMNCLWIFSFFYPPGFFSLWTFSRIFSLDFSPGFGLWISSEKVLVVDV